MTTERRDWTDIGFSFGDGFSTPTDLFSDERRRELAREVYSPIKKWETRVAYIASGETSDTLALTLHTAVILDERAFGLPDEDRIQPYEALSYTWGEPTFSHPVTCNGIEFSVTKNLHLALVASRWFSRVWVIQEIAASGDHTRIEVHYGAAVMCWKDLREICSRQPHEARRLRAQTRQRSEVADRGYASLELLHDIATRHDSLWFGKDRTRVRRETHTTSADEVAEQSPVKCLLLLLERTVESGFEATLRVDHVYALLNVAMITTRGTQTRCSLPCRSTTRLI